MSDHDALCPAYGEQRSPQSCRCRLIAAIRADERAQNEGARVTFTVTADGLVAAIDDPLDVGWTRLALDLIPQLVANDRDARRLAELRAKVEALIPQLVANDRDARRLAELRAKVKALRDRDRPYLGGYGRGFEAAIDDVLDLIDGSNDG